MIVLHASVAFILAEIGDKSDSRTTKIFALGLALCNLAAAIRSLA